MQQNLVHNKNIYYLYSRIVCGRSMDERETRTPFRLSFCSGLRKTGNMKEIKLTQGQVALVDDEDYDYLMQWKWQAHRKRNIFYAVRSVKIKGTRRSNTISMHRVIAKTPDGMETDHKDRNGLNNQKHNLRVCNRSLNSVNKEKNPCSVFRGVILRKDQKRTNPYLVGLNANGKHIYGGYFATSKSAAQAYDVLALKYHGEFANLNFPELKEQYMAELSLSL